MKKLLFFLILLAGIAFPQNGDKQTGYINGQDVLYRVFQKTAELLRVAVIQDSSQQFYMTTDTLNAASDSVKMYFNGQYAFGLITVRDTGSSLTDSLVFQRLDTLTGTYTTVAVGYRDLFTDNITSGAVIVPGAGLTKIYMINEPYPRTYKVTWVYGGDKASRRNIITFTGKR